MKKIVSGFVLFALAACTQPTPPAAPGAEEMVARGQYLVAGLVGCNDCHTPMTPTGPDMSRSLQGATLGFAPSVEMPWGAVAPPLAGGPARFSDEQFVAFLQTGIRPDGSMARPPMPQFRMNEEDAHAVAAYIKSLPRAE